MNVQKYIESKFSNLEFQPEGHIYTLCGKNLTPVSNVVSTFSNEFKVKEEAARYAGKYGLDKEEVLKEWALKLKTSIDIGNGAHSFAYEWYKWYLDNVKAYSVTPSNKYEEAVSAFWKWLISNQYVPVAAEMMMYNSSETTAGTFDLLLMRSDGRYIICDYKTNKDLYKNFMKRLFHPFDFMYDTPFNKYQIQLSMYQILLEDIDIDIAERWIIWLKNTGEYERIITDDLTKYLREC